MKEMKEVTEAVDFKEKVKEIAGGLFEGGWFDQMVEEQLKEALKKAVESQFSYGGAAYTRIKEIVSKNITESLEDYDPGYIPRLETVMQGIIDQTVLGEQKQLLTNFQTFMDRSEIPKPEKGRTRGVISLDAIFKKYCNKIAKEFNTDERAIDYDDEPSYEPVECYASIEKDETYGFSVAEHAFLCFGISDAESEKDQKQFGHKIPIVMWPTEKEWSFYGEPGKLDYGNLAHMDGFLCYLTALRCNNVMIEDYPGELSKCVELNTSPECEWS